MMSGRGSYVTVSHKAAQAVKRNFLCPRTMRRLTIYLAFIMSLSQVYCPVAVLATTANTQVFAAASKKKDDGFGGLTAYEGKTADQALSAAEQSGIDYDFEDSAGVNVNESVQDMSNESEVHDAIVTEVKTYDFWFLGKSVTFVLDYTDPVELAKREKKAEDKKNRDQAAADLESCEGKTAKEVYALAETAGYSVTLYDSFDVNVTKAVKRADEDSDVGNAVVTEAEVKEPWLLFSGSVSAKLDYIDPSGARKREQQELRRQEELLREKSRDDILGSEGENAGTVQELVDSSGFDLMINDEYGTDVTDKVRKAKKGSALRKAKVLEISIDDFSEKPCVTIEIDYATLESVKSYAKEYGYPAEVTFSNVSVEIEDEKPTSYNPSFFVTVNGTITSNDTWGVETYYLPALGTSTSSFRSCAEMELDGGLGKLMGGATRDFTYHYRLNYDSDRVVLQTENDHVVMHNYKEVTNTVTSKFESAKQAHDANLDQAREDERRSREEERKNTTCYYTEKGTHYHSRTGCPSLSRSKNIYETTVGQAESQGLDACDRCY